jgi:hypothetical protein
MKTVLIVFFSFSIISAQSQINVPEPAIENSVQSNPIKQLEEVEKGEIKLKTQIPSDKLYAIIEQELTFNQANSYFVQKWKLYSQNSYRRTLTETELEDLQQYLNRMSQMEPENPRTLLAYYQIGQHSTERYEALKKAEKSIPNDSEILKQTIAFNEIIGKYETERELLVRVFRLTIYPLANTEYAQDVLTSVANDGILIVHGWEDYIAIRYAQLVQNIRNDIKVISLDLLNSSIYRKSLTQNGISIPSQSEINPNFFLELCSQNEYLKIHVSMTVAAPYLLGVSKSIYVKGLTFFYSSVLQDMFSQNFELWESLLSKKTALYGILWVIKFELTCYQVNHINKVPDISVSSSSLFSQLNL